MIRSILRLSLLILAAALPGRAQDGFDFGGFINQECTAEIQAAASAFSGSGGSLTDTLSSAGDGLAPITGNDYVEGALGKGVQALGGGVLGELPIADGSAALGSIAGGDYKTAADTAVSGGMGFVAGWSTAAVVTGLLEGATVTIGGFTAPGWLPPLLAGATAAYATKQAYNWLLQTPPPATPPGDTALSLEAPFPVKPPAATPKPKAPGSTPRRPVPPAREKPDHDRESRGGDKCSDGH